MSINRISARYAKSLLDLAVERNELEIVLKDIEALNEIIKIRDFYLLLKSPIINTGKKLSIFKAVFEGKANKTTLAFYELIIKKGRETYLPEIAVEFVEQYKNLKRISSVTLTTAVALDENLLTEIKSKLQKSPITKETIELTTKVNADLIGGFVIEVGDRLYDASVLYKLDQLKKEFKVNKK